MHSMKIGLKFFAAALAVVLAVGCGSKEDSEEPEKPPVDGPVFEAGSWVLSQWNGSQELAPRSIYLHLAADPFVRTLPEPQYDRLFEIYRHIYRYGVRAEGASFGDLYRRHSVGEQLCGRESDGGVVATPLPNCRQYFAVVAAEIPDYVKDGITVKTCGPRQKNLSCKSAANYGLCGFPMESAFFQNYRADLHAEGEFVKPFARRTYHGGATS